MSTRDWGAPSKWGIPIASSPSDTEPQEIQRTQWNSFPLDNDGCPYDNRVLNHTRWTDEEEHMLMKYAAKTIFVFRLLESYFRDYDDNAVTNIGIAKSVENTRGALPIERSHFIETSLEAGFTPAQFLASSFIFVENQEFAEVLMILLNKRVRLPWKLMVSTKSLSVPSGYMDDDTMLKPYTVLQLQVHSTTTERENNDDNDTTDT